MKKKNETQEVISLGGRRFFRLTKGSTVEHDLWLMKRTTASGLIDAKMWSGETPESYAQRLLSMAIEGGVVLEMLGGLLLPEGLLPEEWTPQMGEETARFLGAITDDREKSLVNQLVLSILIDFFAIGLLSSARSRSSFGNEEKPANPTSDDTANGVESSAH